jgi:hypothetical protein
LGDLVRSGVSLLVGFQSFEHNLYDRTDKRGLEPERNQRWRTHTANDHLASESGPDNGGRRRAEWH